MKELADLLRQSDHIAVLSHVSPDGDTLGSAAALLFALRKMGKHAQWFCDGAVPPDYMRIPELAMMTAGESLKRVQCAVCVDVSGEERLGRCREVFRRAPNRAQIDHHKTNTLFAAVNAVRDRSAAGFVMMELLDELGVEWDDEIARALFVAVMTDTGRLSHADVTEQDVRDTARLYAFDLRPHELTQTLFQCATMTRTKLEGVAIAHMSSAFDGRVTYTWLETADYLSLEADHNDSDGVIELCRRVDGTLISFFLRPVGEGFKVSMRCVPGYDVSEICALFGGGGHTLAAGCTIPGEREEVTDKVLKAIREALL